MYSKTRLGLLPSFQPYQSFQIALSRWVGGDVHPIVPWLLSFLNGAAVVGFVFGRIYRWLPGRNGAVKGLIYGVFGWAPPLFSLAMLLTYSVVLGIVYDALRR